MSEPKTGRRLTHATKNRTGIAFAKALRRINRRYAGAKRIHLVLDNLSTHSEKSLIEALGPSEGQALWRRFKVHFTPKHASWLNAAEMEAGLVSRECLGKRRIGTVELLRAEVHAWSRQAERARRQIEWKFTVNDARRRFDPRCGPDDRLIGRCDPVAAAGRKLPDRERFGTRRSA